MSYGNPHETPCAEVLDRVYGYLDGELDDLDCAKIRQHLDECGPCLREYGLEEAVKRLVRRPTRENQKPAEQADDESLGVAFIADQLRLVAIQTNGTVRFLDPHRQTHSLLYIASLEIQGLKSLIDELEDVINSATATEDDIQQFFERNPRFLCGDTYEAAHPHIILQRPDAGPLIPDFVLKPPNENALCDILELKLPKAKLVVGQSNRRRLSAALMEACAQLREYRDFFEEQTNRDAIEEIYGLRFYRPKMIVVIGKRSDYLANDLRKAECDVPQLIITTYDDVLDRAKTRMRTAKCCYRAPSTSTVAGSELAQVPLQGERSNLPPGRHLV